MRLCVLLFVACVASAAAAPPRPTSEAIIIVEPHKHSDEKVSIVQALSVHPESLRTLPEESEQDVTVGPAADSTTVSQPSDPVAVTELKLADVAHTEPAEKAADEPKPGAEEVAGEPKPATEEATGEPKPAAEEAAGEPKPAAEEATDEPKPATEEAAGTEVPEESLVTVVDDHRQPLPDTSAITGELTEKLNVTNFFALWLVFNDPTEIDLQTGTEFSILSPQQSPPVEYAEADPALVRRILLDHVVLGKRLHLSALKDLSAFNVTALSGRQIQFSHRDGSWFANDARVVLPETEVSAGGELVVLDTYVFSDYTPGHASNLADELSKLPALFNLTRVPIFNKFLANANVSRLLQPGEQYTVLFPLDRAFQRWHPIDWGFYPFSVPEFTAETVQSHFLKGALRYETIADNQTALTLTNRTVLFRKLPNGDLTANGVRVMKRDVALRGGTVLVVSEVLFVDHQTVQQLRELHKDKETPPLVAYPWWNAQFLSHAYLALESDETIVSMQRLLNVASNLHLKVPGKNYSFFVPTEEAFERANLQVPEWWSERGVSDILPAETMAAIERFALRHMVRGRLYQRELRPGLVLHSLDNSTHSLEQLENGKFVLDGESMIERGDIFVYNLGTLFYVDGALGSEAELAELRAALTYQRPTMASSELGEEMESSTGTDVLLEESTETLSTTPSAETDTKAPSTEISESKNAESNDIPAAAP